MEDFLKTEGFHPEVLVTSLPTSRPYPGDPDDFQNVRKIEEIIKYQMEPHVPAPSKTWSWISSPPSRTARPDHRGSEGGPLQASHPPLECRADASGGEPGGRGALFSLCEDPSGRREHPVAILHTTGERRVFQASATGRWDSSGCSRRAPTIGPTKETLNFYSLKDPRPVKEILITGRAAAGPVWPRPGGGNRDPDLPLETLRPDAT